MGIGDDIMMTARIRNDKLKFPDKEMVIVNNNNNEAWSPAYEYNPHIRRHVTSSLDKRLRITPRMHLIKIRPRPYVADIDKSVPDKHRFVFKKHGPQPGEVFLSDQELQFAKLNAPLGNFAPFVYIEPNVKGKVSGDNKSWGTDKYQQVVDYFVPLGVKFIQCGYNNSFKLKQVTYIDTPNIRDAFAILSRAKLYLGNEGCMHHVAAAFNIPGIVIFGGYVSPESTGYDIHKNFYIPDERYPYGCGMMSQCSHCRSSMAKIDPINVITKLEDFLK